MERMKGKIKEYPMFDDLFDAADIGDLAEDQFIAYSQSRLRLEDDREALEYEVAQEREKAFKEGERNAIAGIISHLKAQGATLKQIASTLGRPESEIAAFY